MEKMPTRESAAGEEEGAAEDEGGGEGREGQLSMMVKYPRFCSVLFLSRIWKVSGYFFNINININKEFLFTYIDDDERTMVPVREANIMSQNLSTELVAPACLLVQPQPNSIGHLNI